MARPSIKPRSSAEAKTSSSSSFTTSSSHHHHHFINDKDALQQQPAPRPSTASGTRISAPDTSISDNSTESLLASDQVTEAFIRRTLCSYSSQSQSQSLAGESISRPGTSAPEPASIHELLPPLTSSNEVDLQLYAFIAILIKEFVNPWYSRITSDHVFVDDVLLTIAHCTRALEERIRRLDWEKVLLNDLPDLLDAHIVAYRTAESIANNSSASDGTTILQRRQIYHTLRPHPALSPVPQESPVSDGQCLQENDFMYRQVLAQAIMAILLPSEDLQNPCLFSLVSGTLADLMIGELIAKRLSQGDFLYEMIEKGAEACQSQLQIKSWAVDRTVAVTSPKNRLVQLGLISQPRASPSNGLRSKHRTTYTQLFWILLHYVVMAYAAFRFCISGLFAYSSLPSRMHSAAVETGLKNIHHDQNLRKRERHGHAKIRDPRNNLDTSSNVPPLMSYRIWQVVQRLLFLDVRMPWLFGLASLFHQILTRGPGRLGRTDGRIDRFISYHLLQPLHTPTAYLPSVLRTIRSTLFPNNAIPLSASTAAGIGVGNGRSSPATAPVNTVARDCSRLGERDPASLPSQLSSSSSSSSTTATAPVSAATLTVPQPPAAMPATAMAAATDGISTASVAMNISRGSSSSGGGGDDSSINSKKRAAAIALLNLLPRPVARVYLCPSRPLFAFIPASLLSDSSSEGVDSDEEQHRHDDAELEVMIKAIEESILNLVQDEYLNKHLVYAVLEYLVAAILPELGRDEEKGGCKSVRELLNERGIVHEYPVAAAAT